MRRGEGERRVREVRVGRDPVRVEVPRLVAAVPEERRQPEVGVEVEEVGASPLRRTAVAVSVVPVHPALTESGKIVSPSTKSVVSPPPSRLLALPALAQLAVPVAIAVSSISTVWLALVVALPTLSVAVTV